MQSFIQVVSNCFFFVRICKHKHVSSFFYIMSKVSLKSLCTYNINRHTLCPPLFSFPYNTRWTTTRPNQNSSPVSPACFSPGTASSSLDSRSAGTSSYRTTWTACPCPASHLAAGIFWYQWPMVRKVMQKWKWLKMKVICKLNIKQLERLLHVHVHVQLSSTVLQFWKECF